MKQAIDWDSYTMQSKILNAPLEELVQQLDDYLKSVEGLIDYKITEVQSSTKRNVVTLLVTCTREKTEEELKEVEEKRDLEEEFQQVFTNWYTKMMDYLRVTSSRPSLEDRPTDADFLDYLDGKGLTNKYKDCKLYKEIYQAVQVAKHS